TTPPKRRSSAKNACRARRRASGLPADGHAARAPAAELVWLQRPGDERSAVRDNDPAPARRAESGARRSGRLRGLWLQQVHCEALVDEIGVAVGTEPVRVAIVI